MTPIDAALDAIAADSWYAKGANSTSVLYSAEIFARYWHGQRALELGPAEGVMTDSLAAVFPDLTIVDGAERFCRDLQRRFPQAHVVCSIWRENLRSGLSSGRRTTSRVVTSHTTVFTSLMTTETSSTDTTKCFALETKIARSAISRSRSAGLRSASAFGTIGTSAMTVAHDTTAVTHLITPASR